MERTQKTKLIGYWKAGAQQSLRLAHDVFAKKYYDHALFCGHLALEKMLKALAVEAANSHAPHSHDLVYLAGLARVDLDIEQQKFLSVVNEFNIGGRYHEEKLEFHKRVTRGYAQTWLEKISDFYLWLSKQSVK